MKPIILIGCGNIGFRHLQALSQLKTPMQLTIVEPNQSAWELIRAFIDDNAQAEGAHDFHLRADLPEEQTSYALAVVATSAMHRRAVIENLLERHTVGTMILEKVLFQKLADFDAVEEHLAASQVSAFVNCGRRYWEGYRALQAEFMPERPVDLLVTGNVYGLGSNAVHFLDLAEFLNKACLTEIDGTGLLEGSVAAKRADCVEIFGTLSARLSNGARVTIDCRPSGPISVRTHLSVGGEGVMIDEVGRKVIRDAEATPFKMKNMSEYPEVYQDALMGQSGLVPYADSSRQHRFFLTTVLAHLGLSNDAECMVS